MQKPFIFLLLLALLSITKCTSYTTDVSFTFEVDNVPPKAGVLSFLTPEDGFHSQVGQKLTLTNFEFEGDNTTKLINSPYRMSGVMKAIHAAYLNHYSLKLSVSDFILLIGQGLAQHMEVYAEELRSQFVDFEGKEKIVIETVMLDWPYIVDQFRVKIGERIKTDLVDVILDDTSVATKLSKIATEITVMDSFKNYFEYEVRLICGIPKITLVGSPSDWELLRSKVQKLQELNSDNKLKLDWWLNELVPLVDSIVDQAAKRKVDVDFWKSIYKFQDGQGYSSSPAITGWIIKFNPYLVDGLNMLHQNSFGQVNPSNLGSGVSNVPFILKAFGKTEPMVLYGGFLGAKLMDDGETIGTVYFYAVGPDPNSQQDDFGEEEQEYDDGPDDEGFYRRYTQF